ncbi:MAG: hypothetical protein FXF47_10070 [Candidatus Mcinerneyibacterium aminivorans]|uniref:Uncharacterized protein n=1 Tax=Candidatus Mcinerneyibacterium aminivorans TaxID=2703815 RepID=A0A5D0MI58_9BACT|nr:MAG: hypothetical protein FXF47_10070 [Candidatus Mcinerneyibacterium aminivorans]
MVNNIDEELARIKNFLDLKRDFSRKFFSLKKQNPEKIRDLLVNYDELLDHFKNSKYEKYFMEGFK